MISKVALQLRTPKKVTLKVSTLNRFTLVTSGQFKVTSIDN